MSKFLSSFFIDPLGTLCYSYGRLFGSCYAKVSSFINYLLLFIKRVKFGKNISIRGHMYISRYPGTSIIIGNNCIFNSNYRFNARGINHLCSIATGPNGYIEIGDNYNEILKN